ncbi:MAG: hypothetical protein R3F31_07370 [Verrucomicrobiales bacterium]
MFQATPVDKLRVAKGFQVELLYSVPKDKQGSWVAMCVDNKGRLIVSDQYGALYRLTPPPAGAMLKSEDVEKIDLDIGGSQGMLYAFDSLYVVTNTKEHGGVGSTGSATPMAMTRSTRSNNLRNSRSREGNTARTRSSPVRMASPST